MRNSVSKKPISTNIFFLIFAFWGQVIITAQMENQVIARLTDRKQLCFSIKMFEKQSCFTWSE